MLGPLYNLSIYAYQAAVRIASVNSTKAKQFIEGRKNWRRALDQVISNHPNKQWVWVHASSLGEFEQARPVMEGIKSKDPETLILLTFFSPSGYEVRKDYPLADAVMYMPLDTVKNATDFVNRIPLKLALFVKYEFWMNFYEALNKQGVKLTLFSVILRENHWLVKNRNFAKRIFCKVSNVFTQDDFTYKAISSLNVTKVYASGDTRYDRVYENSLAARKFTRIGEFKDGKRLLVVGSAWLPEIDLVLTLKPEFFNSWKVIIAPHELTEDNYTHFSTSFTGSLVRWSESKDSYIEYDVLWLDTIGMLLDVYSYGNMAIVGGGYGKGIHNILEPISFGLYTLFGPNYQKFNEAKEAIRAEIAGEIRSKDINQVISEFDELEEKKVRNACSEFIRSHLGATKQILHTIEQ